MTDKELMYLNIGKIIHIAQTIEYNLSTIIAFSNLEKELKKRKLTNEEIKEKLAIVESLYDEISRKPLGYSMELAKETHIFTDDFLVTLNKALHSRNYYAHRFFKEKITNDKTNKDISEINKDLEFNIKRLTSVNNELADDLSILKIRVNKLIK